MRYAHFAMAKCQLLTWFAHASHVGPVCRHISVRAQVAGQQTEGAAADPCFHLGQDPSRGQCERIVLILVSTNVGYESIFVLSLFVLFPCAHYP